VTDRTTIDIAGTASYRLLCAEWAAGQGWHLFPLGVGSKTPALGESWPTMATTDPERIAAWCAADYNYGIACAPSGLLVVDEDEPGAFGEYASRRGQQVPATFTVSTGRGRHFYFRQPEGLPVPNSAGLSGLHLDVRGHGGYVVGPGSIHPTGDLYQPGDWHADLASCPEWLAQALAEPKATTRRVNGEPWDSPPSSSRFTEPAPEGERHDRAVRLAYWLRQRDLPYDLAEMAMSGWFARVEQPPVAEAYYDWSDAEKALTSAYELPVLEDANEEQETPLYADVATLLAGGPVDPPKPTVLGRLDGHALFYEGQVNVLFGDSEAGKTWVAKGAVAETLLAGGSALVVDVDHNGVQATVTHLRALGVPTEVLGDQSRFRYTDAEDAALLRRVIADARRWRPDIALIDCVGEVMAMLGLNSNSPDDYTRFHTMVPKPMAAAGTTTVTIDHLPKSPETKALGATGTHAKKRTVGGVMLRVKVDQQFTPGQGGSCYLTVHKDRHGGVREHCPTGEREPLAGKFVLADRDGSLGWHITAPNKEESRQAEMDRTGVGADVDALRGLDPPPESIRDVLRRMPWGQPRATAAFKAFQEAYPYPGPRGEIRDTPADEPDPDVALMAKPLTCEECGDFHAMRWGEPWWVVRCKPHNPLTYKKETT
jgi:hypothetical protein